MTCNDYRHMQKVTSPLDLVLHNASYSFLTALCTIRKTETRFLSISMLEISHCAVHIILYSDCIPYTMMMMMMVSCETITTTYGRLGKKQLTGIRSSQNSFSTTAMQRRSFNQRTSYSISNEVSCPAVYQSGLQVYWSTGL